MNSRERVKACLTFSGPDRVPRDLWSLPAVNLFQKDEIEALRKKYPTDFDCFFSSIRSDYDQIISTGKTGSYRDDWGSLWTIGEPGVIGEVKEPALADWGKLPGYQPPWHLIRGRQWDEVNRSYEKSDKFILSEGTARPFERLQFIRGTENLFIDIAYDTQEFRHLLKMVHDYFLEDIQGWCTTSVDGIMMLDDWGTNLALLISPKTWRAIFKPLYREYCDLIHQAGKFAFFHTDGHIEAIYEDLIEVGMDAINSQLFCMNIEELGRKYRGKVTFWGEIDRQKVLSFGTPEDVREAVMRVRRALDTGHGGVIAQCEWGKNNSAKNIEAVYQAWNAPLE